MRIDILTLFPSMFDSVLDSSIIGRVQDKGLVGIQMWDIRNYSDDPHKKVDARAYGGGPGMLMCAQPIFSTVDAIKAKAGTTGRLLITSPQGRKLDQAYVEELSRESHISIIAGHYEGVDERVITGLQPEEFSLGDFILTGGELPAMVLIDSVSRILPGALGDNASAIDESFSDDVLEYPQYTRPENFRGMSVPDVLLSGNHKKIREWRRSAAVERTKQKRPDLI